MAQFDAFLKLDGIPGESTDSKHKDEIDIESFSWGESLPVGSGGKAGKPSFQDFSFVTKVSQASPRLFLACASGQHIKYALLTGRKEGGGSTEFYTIKMSDILVSSYKESAQTGGTSPSPVAGGATLPPSVVGSAGLPLEQISLNFSKIEIDYFRQGAAAPVHAGWDVKSNTKV